MYSIFYIYIYKYTRPSNTLTLSRTQCPYKPIPHKQPDKLYSPTSRRPQAIYIWAKCTSRIMHQAIQLVTYIYAAILKNCIMRSMFQLCLCL